ncbi:YebO family protein [Serratia sp. Ag1]|uniref:YebO family protein n=1 Tax=Serratia sp. Ag1 TaxID=1524467 RepID=UPI00056A5B5B|nr:YebO family protein [Serratia sp. Ag1]
MYRYGGGYEYSAGAVVLIIILWIIGIAVWFYLNRASVRANRQIELLESIDKKMNAIIDLEIGKMSSMKGSYDSCSEESKTPEPTNIPIAETLKEHFLNKKK